MADGPELKVSALLWGALPDELRDSATEEARRIMILAAYLDSLSAEFGLSEHHEDQLIKRARRPAGLLPLVDYFLGVEAATVDAEILRNKLYAVLADLAERADAGLITGPKGATVDSTRLFAVAQTYWALSWDETMRPALALRPGSDVHGRDKHGAPTTYKSVIWVDAKAKDLATIRRTERADSMVGLGETSGAALRAAGAHLAVLAAHQLVYRDNRIPPSLDGVQFVRSESGSRGHRVAVIKWRAREEASREDGRSASGEFPHDKPSSDAILGELQQLGNRAHAAGLVRETVFLREAVVRMLQDLSDRNPVDHETQLATERLRAGFSCVNAGRMEEALDHFTSAERSSLTLSALTPGASVHKIRLASSLTMIGLIHLQSGDNERAEPALFEAVSVSQQLTDEDAQYEDLLAIALIMLGLLGLQSEQTVIAERNLTRAMTISDKLLKQKPDDGSAQSIRLLALNMLGTFYWASSRTRDAELALMQAAALSRRMAARDSDNSPANLLLANMLVALGALYLDSDRVAEAEGSLREALNALEQVPQRDPDDAVPMLQAVALNCLGSLYLSADRTGEAETVLARAVRVCKQLVAGSDDPRLQGSPLGDVTALLGGALLLLAACYAHSGREIEAEDAFVQAIDALQQSQTALATLSDAIQGLADLRENQEIEGEEQSDN